MCVWVTIHNSFPLQLGCSDFTIFLLSFFHLQFKIIMSSMNSLAHLRIPLDDIKLATNDFNNENVIGVGGFGKVYKGELSRSEGRITVAVKRLDRNGISDQGQREFLMEITTLSRYQHENIVTLVGFCDEKGEMILVYEHMDNGSLDIHLSRIGFTWSQRLKICCSAARGLLYLHNPDGGLQSILHRDIKSSNILLDHMGKAKISDFGLAKLGPTNQQFLVTKPAGTHYYCDPQYIETGFLTKESDVYSFGVVLFEVLCGRSCVENFNDNRRFLTRLVEKSYKENKMDDIIDDNIKAQMDPDSRATFIDVAYRCLKKERDERPTMAQVVKELKLALDLQEKWIAKVADLQSTLSIFKRKYKLRQIAQLRDENLDYSSGIDFDCDEELFATAGAIGEDRDFIKIYNLSKIVNEPLVEHHPVVDIQTSSWLYGLSWNKNIKNHIATCDYEGRVTIWDVNNKQNMMEYKEHEGKVYNVDFSCTEPSLLVSGGLDDSKVKIWSANQKTSVATINIEDYVYSVKYHPGNSMHIAVGAGNGCHYYDLRNTSHSLNIFTRLITDVTNVRFLSDDELVFASIDNTLRLWDIKQNLIVGTYKGHTSEGYVTGLSINSDFMACGSERNEVFLYHKAFSKPLTCHALGSPFRNDKYGNATSNNVGGVCWKSDGSTIVACNNIGVVQVLAFEAQHK